MVYSRLHTSTHQRFVKCCPVCFCNIALYSKYHALLSKKSCTALLRIFFQIWVFSRSFLYIINIAGRIGEAAMGGARGAQRLDLVVKKTGARSARARTRGQKHTSDPRVIRLTIGLLLSVVFVSILSENLFAGFLSTYS